VVQGGEKISFADHFQIRLRMIFLDLIDDLFDADHKNQTFGHLKQKVTPKYIVIEYHLRGKVKR
jgi:hypothetical protein